MSATTLRRAHAVHPIAAIQIEYSPFFLDIEGEKAGLLKTCRKLGIAVVAYSPLGRGMLTGTYVRYSSLRNNFPPLKDNYRNLTTTSQTANGGRRFQSNFSHVLVFRFCLDLQLTLHVTIGCQGKISPTF